MLDFYNNKLREVEEALKQLIEDRSKAGVETQENYDLQISKKQRDLEYFQNLIKKEESKTKPTTPENSEVHLYIISGTKSRIQKCIGDNCICHMEEDRYHDTEISKWIPFNSAKTIEEIVEEFKSRYPIIESYLENDPDDAIGIHIEDNETKTIGIIDILSIDDENESFVKCFDRLKIGGVILPHCREITKHEEVFQHAKATRERVFSRFFKRLSGVHSCNNFLFDLSDYQNFYRRLRYILNSSCRIVNKVQGNNPVSDLNMGL